MAKTHYKPPFILSHINGWKQKFDDLSELQAVVKAAGMKLSDDRTMGEWCAFDKEDDIVPNAVATTRPWSYRDRYMVMRYGEQYLHAQRLGLPVPGTGNRGHRGRNYYRRPHHMNIYRANEAHENYMREDHLPFKVVRTKHYVPNAYDDVLASDWGHRTWKRSRRTRWKTPKSSKE